MAQLTTLSSLSTLCITSFSIFFKYASIFDWIEGMDAPKIRMASKAALVLLLIATVATGIPRYR